jgi:hypothetical protein
MFMLGVIVACGIEVLVDWNSTLFEINVLRNGMRDRGFNYVGILGKSSTDALSARDDRALATLTSGLFDDQDVVFVQFTTPDGAIVYERIDQAYEQRRKVAFREFYGAQIARDVDGILRDPEALRRRMSASRYRDFAQRWSDAMERLKARFVGPKPLHAGGNIVYQDRLRTPYKERDDAVTYALGALRDANGKPMGALVIAFSMERTNSDIRAKYLKGLGMVVFFVGLILVQNIVSRRDKLRLLDLEARYGRAKEALRKAFAAPVVEGPLRFAAAVDQAPGAVDGMAWDGVLTDDGVELALIDPDGDGIDAAAVAQLLLGLGMWIAGLDYHLTHWLNVVVWFLTTAVIAINIEPGVWPSAFFLAVLFLATARNREWIHLGTAVVNAIILINIVKVWSPQQWRDRVHELAESHRHSNR